MRTKISQIVVDISASTKPSHQTCTTLGCHFIGFEPDKEIFDCLVKPLCEFDNSSNDDSNKDQQRGLCN